MPAASRLDIHLLAIAASMTVAACGPAPQQGGFHGFPPADVTLMTVESKSIPVTFEYVGQALGSKEVEVRARVGGILEKRLFKEGAPVKSGQTLFVIDPKPYEAQAANVEAELARAQAQRAQAQREAARLKPLVERKAVGQKEYDDAVSTSELADAAVEAAEANLRTARLNLGYTRVIAPITGLSSRATKSEGSLVSVGADNVLNSGQFVRVTLNGPTRLNAITVPQAAVLDGPQGKFVYVAGKDKDSKDVAIPKPVTLGDWVTGEGTNLWLVESGLAVGDR